MLAPGLIDPPRINRVVEGLFKGGNAAVLAEQGLSGMNNYELFHGIPLSARA